MSGTSTEFTLAANESAKSIRLIASGIAGLGFSGFGFSD
jgi:hypothetical protein